MISNPKKFKKILSLMYKPKYSKTNLRNSKHIHPNPKYSDQRERTSPLNLTSAAWGSRRPASRVAWGSHRPGARASLGLRSRSSLSFYFWSCRAHLSLQSRSSLSFCFWFSFFSFFLFFSLGFSLMFWCFL